MKKILSDLKQKVFTPGETQVLDSETWDDFKENCIIVLMAGGESARFREVNKSSDVNKNAFALPNGDTMIEMSIRMYRDSGFKSFVVLAYHGAESLEDLLGNGKKLGVSINFSYDKGPFGKGGAVKHAVENGSIGRNKHFIVHNPDDLILDYEGSFPKDIVAAHLSGAKNEAIATAVVVEEVPLTYTGMKIEQGFVSSIDMYPMLPIPAHIGVTVFSPGVVPYFDRLFDYTKKSEFEKVLFPLLAGEKKLYAISIPGQNWLAVNNHKTYKVLLSKL